MSVNKEVNFTTYIQFSKKVAQNLIFQKYIQGIISRVTTESPEIECTNPTPTEVYRSRNKQGGKKSVFRKAKRKQKITQRMESKSRMATRQKYQ